MIPELNSFVTLNLSTIFDKNNRIRLRAIFGYFFYCTLFIIVVVRNLIKNPFIADSATLNISVIVCMRNRRVWNLWRGKIKYTNAILFHDHPMHAIFRSVASFWQHTPVMRRQRPTENQRCKKNHRHAKYDLFFVRFHRLPFFKYQWFANLSGRCGFTYANFAFTHIFKKKSASIHTLADAYGVFHMPD